MRREKAAEIKVANVGENTDSPDLVKREIQNKGETFLKNQNLGMV